MPGTLRVLWRVMSGQRLRYVAAIASIALATMCMYLVPLVGRATIDEAVAKYSIDANNQSPPTPVGGQPAANESPSFVVTLLGGIDYLAQNLWLAALAMIAFTALAGVFTYMKGRLAARACEGISRKLRNRLYDHLNKLPCSYLDKADTGDLVQRCTSDVETTRLFLSVQVVDIGNALILLVTVLPIMLMLDVGMTIVSMMLVPVIIVFALIFFVKVKHRFRAVEEAESKMTTVVQENLTGIRVVRAFARQEFERDKFAQANAEYRDRSFRLVRLMAWYWTTSDVLVLSQMALALAFGAYWIAQGQITVGTLYAFLAYLQMMLWPVRQMGRILTDLGKAVVALGRIREILTEQEEADVVGASAVGRQPEAVTAGESDTAYGPRPTAYVPSGSLTIRHLTFAYDTSTHPVLDDITVTVAAGQTLALVGPSGAGTATLMALLLRLYDYEQGEILFDDREIRSLPRQFVRSNLGVVMQEPFLFAKSLGENIRHGKSTAMENEIQEAASAAQIHATIATFDKKYDTIIGERGVNLSGGQRQRIAIARAIVRDPAILILDDALSAVDSQTESQILTALHNRRGRRTTILIAHRLSTLMQADQILVMDKGRIVQRGTHETLRKEKGMYERLWRIQSQVEEDLEREMQNA